jgi:hypothetical protein
MPAGSLRWLVIGSAVLLAVSAKALAEEPMLTDDEVVVRAEGAHRLLLPKDWPVEEKDGRFIPASLTDYLSMKFGQVAARLEQVTQRLEAIERKLQKVEDDLKTTQMRVKLLEVAQRDSDTLEGR